MAGWTRPLVCALLALGLLGPVADTATAQGRKTPDLTVASVTAPATAKAGGKATLRVRVRNGGTAKAAATTTSFHLSTDRKAGRDRALTPSLRTRALRPRRTWSGQVAVTIPAAVAAGGYYVVACADSARRVRERKEGNNCRVSARVTVTGPRVTETSHELIDADVAKGLITPEQGLIYKVFSSFRDPRLPAKYRGVPDGLTEGALEEAATAWPDLTPAGQATLRPFLIPPYYAGSHWTPAQGATGRQVEPSALGSPWCAGSGSTAPVYQSWNYLDVPGGHFRIWWLRKHDATDSVLAGQMSTVLQKVLPVLEQLMGHSYKPDGGGFCDGGSPAVDIALVEAGTAEVIPDDTDCGQAGTSTHVVWPRTKPVEWAGNDPYLAHEVMHMIQFAMPVAGKCNDYIWLREMTAEWVQDYVTDPIYGIGLGPDDTEHLAAPRFLDVPRTSLDAPDPPGHAYGTYLLAQWGARKGGQGFIKDIWTNAATMKATAAVDAALPGDGFESTWADFALSNWNRGPVRDYKDWDDMMLGAKPIGPEWIPAGHPRNPTVHVEHLAAQYLELDIDQGVTQLEVENDMAGDINAELRAVVTYDDGSHRIIDLSDEPTTTICIDDGTKRATSVVLIFSNSHQTEAVDFKPTLTGTASCGCPDAPAGLAAEAEAQGATCTGNLTFSWTEEITDYNDDGTVESESQASGRGTLGIGFLSPDPAEPEIWQMDPASTYSVTKEYHGETHRACAEVLDETHEGEGQLGDLATFASDDPDSDRVLVSTLVGMRTTWEQVHMNCGGTFPSSGTDVLLVPGCPVLDGGGRWFWEFEPTAPGSDTYTFECSDIEEYEDGLGVHNVTVSISGTITLP